VERFRERDPLERRFLEVLAIAGAPIPYQVIARAASIDVGECQTRLGGLRAAQLIRLSRRGDERLVVPYHDRVREAILVHRGDEAGGAPRAVDHLSLGRALLESTAPDALASRVFGIVQHLNAGRELITEPAERARLAELNLLAAREALLATAYDSARAYAAVGIALLGDSGWTDAYATARDLHLEQMRAEFLAGDGARARASFDRARERITAPLERTDLYVTWIELEFNRGDFAAALASGRERLREVCVRLPRRVSVLGVLVQYVATRWAQRGRTPDDLRALPASTHVLHESAQKVLMAVAPAAYWVSSNMIGWVSLKVARMTMQRGVTDASAYGLGSYGALLAGAFRKCVEAAALGRLALALHERFPNERLTAKLLMLQGQFLAVWVQPFAETKRFLEASHQSAVRQGDTTYEALAACCLSHMSAVESADLTKQEEISTWARDVCLRRHDFNTAGSCAGHLRFASGLRGTVAIDFASGRTVEPAFFAIAGEPAKSPSAYGAYWVYGAWLAYLFGEIGVAEEWLDEQRRYEQTHFAHAAMLDLCFLECLVAAKVHDRASWPRRALLRASIARRVRKLRSWANGCKANFEAHYLIARAELARVRGCVSEAEQCLERAAASSREHGAVLREAIAWELASSLAEASGDRARAAERREAAIDAYRRCGATAKVARLQLRAPVAPARGSSPWSQGSR
jgi:hypothetical protein